MCWRSVAKRLGNTVAVCHKSYVHPTLLELAAEGLLQSRLERDAPHGADVRRRGWSAAERRLLHFHRSLRAPDPALAPSNQR